MKKPVLTHFNTIEFESCIVHQKQTVIPKGMAVLFLLKGYISNL